MNESLDIALILLQGELEEEEEESDDEDISGPFEDIEIPKEFVKLSMVQKLTQLGDDIGRLDGDKKTDCFSIIRSMQKSAQEAQSAQRFTAILKSICRKERYVYYQSCQPTVF